MMLADRAPSTSRTFHRFIIVAAVSMTAACVYFNALYNANNLFDRGRKEIEAGSTARGRVTLERSIEKAERILANHPDSRWADDALRLIARARLLREEWPEAADASRRLMTYATSHRDSARIASYLGTAELHLEHFVEADSLLSIALAAEKDSRVRAELLYNRARARHQLSSIDAADADYRAAAELRPNWLDPRLARARMLVEYGRGSEAAFDLAAALRMVVPGHEEVKVMEAARYVAEESPETGLAALVEVESSGLSRVNKAILLILRGDLKQVNGNDRGARSDYEAAVEIAGNSRNAVAAYLAMVRLDLKTVATIEELGRVKILLEEASLLPPGPGSIEVSRMLDITKRIEYWVQLGELGYLVGAEAARDGLGALRLARHLFLEYAGLQPDALWAAKALLAALDLTGIDSGRQDDEPPEGPSAEELRRRLMEDYSDSAYVQVFTGGSGGEFTYEELEAGLRRQMQRLKTLADQALRPRPRPTRR